MRKAYLVTLFFGVLSICSCEDFLEVNPLDSLSAESVLTTESGLGTLLNGLYSADGNMTWAYRTGYVFMSCVGTDELYFRFNDNFRRNVEQHSSDPLGQSPAQMFNAILQTIESANSVIDLIERSDLNQELKDRGLAEARFIRGWAYFDGIRMFGELPIVTKAVATVTQAKDTDVVDFSRKSVSEIYEKVIIPDLNFAVENLAEEPRLPGTPTSWVARSLLAKAYLQGAGQFGMDDYWGEAVPHLKAVIISGKYSLEVPQYSDIFSIENESSGSQRIFVKKWSRVPNGGNMMSHFGAAETTVENNVANGLIWSAGSSRPVAGGQRSHPYIAFYNSFDFGDARRDASISDYTDYYTDSETMELVLPSSTASTHAVRKYNYDAVAKTSNGRDGHDRIFIRLADVYLMLAEALNEINNGPNIEAFEAINSVRRRAGISDLIRGSVINGHFTYGTGSYEIGSQVGFRMAILRERAWELCFEGHRRYDLNRHGLLDDMVLDRNTDYDGDPTDGSGWDEEQPEPLTGWVSGREFYPIPTGVATLNGWDQNQGY